VQYPYYNSECRRLLSGELKLLQFRIKQCSGKQLVTSMQSEKNAIVLVTDFYVISYSLHFNKIQ
jgi:hypothetical protein